MYVSDRSADSIWDTWWAFLVMKSSYRCIHLGGSDRMLREPPGGDAGGWLCMSAPLAIWTSTLGGALGGRAAASGRGTDKNYRWNMDESRVKLRQGMTKSTAGRRVDVVNVNSGSSILPP